MRLLPALLMACLATLAGCGRDSGQPVPVVSSSPAANPGAKEPALPDAATKPTASGAASFVAYYVKLLDYASLTGDTTTLSRVSLGSCQGCQDYIKLYADTYAKGGWFKGGTFVISDVRLLINPANSMEVRINTNLHVTAGTWRKDGGSTVATVGAGTDPVAFQMLYQAGWTMTELANITEPK